MLFRHLLHLLTGTNAVAVIIGRKGGRRVVVGPLANMKYHVAEGEKLIVTPLRIKGSVSWDDIPRVIEATREHVR